MSRRTRERDAATLESLRAKLDAIESDSMASAIRQMEETISACLHRAQILQTGTSYVVERLWHKVIEQERELTTAVEQVVNLCALLTERVEAGRLQQVALVEALSSLGHRLPPAVPHSTTTQLLGGSVFATDTSPRADDVVVPVDDVAVTARDHDHDAWGGNDTRRPEEAVALRGDGWHASN